MVAEVIDLARFDFDKERKVLTIASEIFGGGFPEVIEVKSHHTGNVIKFIPDAKAAEDNEGWDGEECHYIPEVPVPNVVKLVVYHAW